MPGDRGMVIAKRSVSLSKAYIVLGVGMTLVGTFFFALSGLIGSVQVTGSLTSSGTTADAALGVPYLAVPFQALAAILFSTPVLLLFVYDKNNGVLEYMLSLGMSQRDIYRQYLKATLILAGSILAFAVVIDAAVGALEGTADFSLGVAGLVVAFALPAASLGAILMMSFSSLQKQRMGSNQPLGMAVGAGVVFPAYFLPLAIPSIAFEIDLLLATVIFGLSLLAFSLSSRWISREKLLP